MFKSISTFLPAGPVAALVLLCGAAASSGPFGAAPALAASAPVVSNVTAAQRDSTFLVDIGYDVADADGDPLFITILFSPDGGATWPVICRSVSGDAGAGVLPGDGKSVVWDARADYPGMILGAGIVRVTANDELPIPRLARLFRSALDGSGERALAPGDTIGFGEPVHIGWEFAAPSLAGLDPAWIAAQDSVAPFDDGILGAKWFSSLDGCIPALEDCWHPRRFNEATGDSDSYFAPVWGLDLRNDGSGADLSGALLPSGALQLHLNALDIVGLEAGDITIDLVVNHDPQTIVLDNETDWAHPADPEVYPYYIHLDDPAQEHHPFGGGDRVPDRTYVVFKALVRDDPRDQRLDPGQSARLTGHFEGVRTNTFGGLFSFASDASEIAPPAWPATCDTCWAADTLGFLVGPSTEFTMKLQAVDEHDRRDGTPASLAFEVGYPPCVQCVELLPKSSATSQFGPGLECVADPAASPCLAGTTEFRITQSGTEPDALQFFQSIFMLVDKDTYAVRLADSSAGQEATNYVVDARLYRMSVLLHGRDDPRDAWNQPLRRVGGWRYQIDHECDPFNQLREGGGPDDILDVLWGEDAAGLVDISNVDGLWRLEVDVVVPSILVTTGADIYLTVLTFAQAGGDPAVAQNIFDATTKQLGAGVVQAVALDQTRCDASPARPARFHYFRGVRPSGPLPVGLTWRDCYLPLPGLKGSLELSNGAMQSGMGLPVTKEFRIVVATPAGDYVCSGP